MAGREEHKLLKLDVRVRVGKSTRGTDLHEAQNTMRCLWRGPCRRKYVGVSGGHADGTWTGSVPTRTLVRVGSRAASEGQRSIR